MSAIFLKTLNLAISASWLIVAVILVRLLLKKTPRWIFCLLWGLVALRLICPFSLESALSLIPSSEAIPADITMDRRPQINSGVRVIDNVVNPVIERKFAPSIENSVNPMQVVVYVASIIWIIGLVVMFIYAFVSYVSLRKRVRASVRVYDNVMQCDEVRSPFILGMLRPVIYVPSDMTEKTLELVLAHENAHIKRLDHWWKPLGFALLSVYWFNPLCWVAYILMCRDIEVACDEKVICDKGREYVVAYSQALLDCSIKRRYIAACPLAFGETGVKERIKSVLNYRKPAFWIVIAALIGCVALTICFLTDPIKKSYVQAETVREEAEGAETAGKEAERAEAVRQEAERAEAVRQEAERAEAVRQETEKTETGVENYSAYPWEKPVGYDNAIAMVKRVSSAFSPTVNLQDMEGADLTEILYSDKDRIIFSGYYGLFVYSKKERTVTNGIDLEAIGCQYTQGDSYCEKRVSEDGKKVYLHPVNLDKMYVWDITTATDTLIVCPYDFENIKFHERSTEWNEDYNPGDYDCWSGNDHFYMTLLHHGGLIGELCYADVITDIDSNVQWYPLFSQLGGLAGVVDFEPGDIHDISEADIWIAGILPPELGLEEGRGYRLHCDDPKILSEIEAILSNAVEDKTMAACPFYTALYLTRDDGVVGTVFPATDSCTIYQSGGVTYSFGEGSNEKLWKLIRKFKVLNIVELNPNNPIGLSLKVTEVTPTGCKLIFSQKDGDVTGELETGQWYELQVRNSDGEWIDNSAGDTERGWEDIAYLIKSNKTTEMTVDWEQDYGRLKGGHQYRIVKKIMDFRGAGDYDEYEICAEFYVITDEK